MEPLAWNRTGDLRVTKAALYHLSYSDMVPLEGLEPSTRGLEHRQSLH